VSFCTGKIVPAPRRIFNSPQKEERGKKQQITLREVLLFSLALAAQKCNCLFHVAPKINAEAPKQVRSLHLFLGSTINGRAQRLAECFLLAA
jgi:hypothetical protein